MSDEVLNRVTNLLSWGYDVRFLYDEPTYVTIRITKNNVGVAAYLSLTEINMTAFDLPLYTLNYLVDLLDSRIAGY